MLTLAYQRKELPFIYPFTTAHGLKTVQPTLIVQLGFKGVYGYGEATEIVYYNQTIDKMMAVLDAKRSDIERYSLIDPERFWHYLHHLIPNEPFLTCALDIAAWDLFAKLRNKKIYELWHENYNTELQTDYTIGIDEPEVMLKKLKDKPWPIYKVKVGTADDVATLALLRQHTQSKIRIDANAGWTYEMALSILPELEKLNIELIEQPLPKGSWEAVAELAAKTSIPIIADEDCVSEQDVSQCCKVYDGINIKLTKCGGITPALRMIEEARGKNKIVMMGCMNESTIGAAAMAQFSSQLDFLDADGPLLHKIQIGKGLSYQNAAITLSADAGLGLSSVDF